MGKQTGRVLVGVLLAIFLAIFAWMTIARSNGTPSRALQRPAANAINDATGNRIAFMSLRDGNAQVYLTSADPADPSHDKPINLSYSKSNDQHPSWSPDGKQIVYTSDRDGNGEICVMQADGSGQMCLTNNRTPNRKFDPKKPEDRSPVWSADGKHIAFVSTRDGTAQIYVMDYDGSNITNLTRNVWDNFEPAWSSDLKKMAYVNDRDGNLNLCIMDASGFNQTCLTNNRTPNRKFDQNRPNDFLPSWSPDNKHIAFVSTRDKNEEIYLMNADGSDPVNLSQNIANDTQPSWSSDGNFIVFSSNRSGRYQLWIMGSDGSNPTPLTVPGLDSQTGGSGANSSNIGDSNVVLVANYLGSPSSPLTDCVLNSDTAKGGDCFPAWEPAALDPNASPTQTLTPTPSGIEFTPYFQVTPTASVVPSLTPPPNGTSNCPTPVVINVGMSGRAALVGQATVWNLSASGGTGPYTMLVVNPGNLPPGMNLTGNSTTGYAISGTPNTPGAYTFTVSATDAKGNSGSATFTVSIYSIKPKALPNGQATVAYSQTFTVLGGTLPISFIPQSGPACGSTNFALPCGMNLSALGVISGTTTEVGTFSFNVQFSDKNNNAISVPYTLTINPGKPAKMIYVSGSGNTARVSTAFPPLIVLVEDGAGNPVQGGITVTFTSVAAGTGADVQGSPLTATTAANGQASVTPTANTKAGGPYTVTVSSAGTNTIPFDLTN